MDAREFFLVGHALSHSGKLVDVEGYDSWFYEDRAVNGLSEAQLRLRPQGLNSIAIPALAHCADRGCGSECSYRGASAGLR